MDNRYKNNEKIINNSSIYKQYLQERDIKKLIQYSTFDFGNLKDINSYGIDSVLHRVEPYDKLYTISDRYYNSPEYGWLILYTNKRSNEMQIKTGDFLTIYLPLENVLGLLRNV